MRKRMKSVISILMTLTIVLGSVARVPASSSDAPADASAPEANVSAPDAGAEKNTDLAPAAADVSTAASETEGDTNDGAAENQDAPDGQNASGSQNNETGSQDEAGSQNAADGQDNAGGQDDSAPDNADISGTVTTNNNDDVAGVVTVEQDKNDDKVEIKKNDKPYLALGTDLTAEQQATVLALMGIDAAGLADYDVVYVNNAEEHQYLDSYIDKSKIGTRSLSSIVIVEREDGNGINISTNNITYCTVGMYKNALATAGIQNADIIVAGPFPISGTAALVGIFKAYKEMTGDEIDEENIDAALNELVVTGQLEAGGASSDDIEGMIAYVKQAVVEHDMSDESEIRKAIAEGCEKFDLTLTDEEMEEIVKLMKKISELDLDLDGLLNAAQSIYDKIANADGGFWAKIRELLQTLWDKIKELF